MWKTRPLCVICIFAVLTVKILTGLVHTDHAVLDSETDGRYVEITGKVSSVSETKGYDGPVLQVYLSGITIAKPHLSYPDKKVRVYIMPDEDLHIGQYIKISGRVSLYEKASNPGQFDVYEFYSNKGVLCDIRDGKVLAAGREYAHVRDRLYRIRLAGEGILAKYLDEEDAAIIKAMLFGNKNEIDDDTKELFRKNGIAHILAISGLHISFLAMLLYKILGMAGLSVRIRAAVSETAIILYGMMVGFTASSYRAICMFTLFLISKAIKRTYDMLTAMSAALTLVSLTTPGMLGDSGLMLSYMAVLGVGYFCNMFVKTKGTDDMDGIRGHMRYLFRMIDAAEISLFVFLTTLPVLLMTYSEAAFYSVLLNMVIIPLMSILLIASISLVIAGGCAISGIGIFMAWAVEIILGFYKITCKILTDHNMGRINAGCPDLWQIAVFYILLVFAVNYAGKHKHVISCSVLVLSVALLFIHPFKGIRVWMLDIGQGDCMVIRSSDGYLKGSNTYIIDCGSSSKKEVGEKRLIPMLKYYGVKKVDGVFITHPDDDHVNGIEELINEAAKENLKIGNIYAYDGFVNDGSMPDTIKEYGITAVRSGSSITDGKLKFRILYPYSGHSTADPNAASLMMDVGYGDLHILTTGDADTEGEEFVCDTDPCLSKGYYSLLKVGHHGSDTSSGERFIASVVPKISLISCSRNNPYGHPHRMTVERLNEAGSTIYRTDKSGAIMIYSNGDRIRVKTYLR